MGLIANNIIIGDKKIEQVVSKSQPVQPQIFSDQEKPINENIDTSQHHILVVNGKQKKLSKKSSYLLDMLEIEEEQ